ncbi:MAG: hypothetical protein EOO73_23285 [Myxococcales bacterium]|nr:MAG: hypothetical protein EOO73_23285 [Myxococcales bacterium]
MRVGWLSVVACGSFSVGCDPEAKLCHERMTSAQPVVAQVDGKSIESVERSLALVTQAHAACEKAKLGTEREQLLKAKNELSAQLEHLKARELRRKVKAPSPEELATLLKRGDPNCPKGQAYKPKGAAAEVRCTGAQLADLSQSALKDYYADRRYKLTTQEAPPELRAELGSELYVFTFDKAGDAAPRCITAYAAPGMSWQEVTARLTGTPPEKLKLNAPVRSGRGELALRVEHAEDKPTIHLGQCGQIVAPP